VLGTTPVKGADPVPLDTEVSPDGRTLYVNESAAHAVGVFAVQGGDLTELQTRRSSCRPAPQQPEFPSTRRWWSLGDQPLRLVAAASHDSRATRRTVRDGAI
jgi:hypothetical protein